MMVLLVNLTKKQAIETLTVNQRGKRLYLLLFIFHKRARRTQVAQKLAKKSSKKPIKMHFFYWIFAGKMKIFSSKAFAGKHFFRAHPYSQILLYSPTHHTSACYSTIKVIDSLHFKLCYFNSATSSTNLHTSACSCVLLHVSACFQNLLECVINLCRSQALVLHKYNFMQHSRAIL